MSDRILDFSEQPASLSVRNDLLVVRLVAPASSRQQEATESAKPANTVIPANAGIHRRLSVDPRFRGGDDDSCGGDDDSCGGDGDSCGGDEEGGAPQDQTIPLEEIAVIVAAHPQVTFTLAVVAGLARHGGLLVTCDERRQPAAMMLPLETHHVQTVRYAAQAALSLPSRKRVWQQIARAKIKAQARLLEERTGKDWGLGMMAERVRSGDPENLEAQAARLYWPRLLGESFRRSGRASGGRWIPARAGMTQLEVASAGTGTVTPAEAGVQVCTGNGETEQDRTQAPPTNLDGANALLNYGYAVLRATVARAICAAGLHPTFGLHHRNRYDAFCLADDLMEPFRPLVDAVVARLVEERGENVALDRESKRALIEPLLGRFSYEQECRTLFDWLARTAFSLAAVVSGDAARIEIPKLVPGDGKPRDMGEGAPTGRDE